MNSTASPVQDDSVKLEGESLENALRQQLEYYFSKQNLATDTYLRSQMNGQQYVGINVIAGFRRIKQLTEDQELLLKILKQCRSVVVDETETMVKPTVRSERTTLILREIPSSTPLDEIKSLFDDNCGKILNIRPDIDDTWFVSFENEEDCINTHLLLQEKTFQGKPIACRVKSETLVRSYFYSAQPVISSYQPDQQSFIPNGGRYRYNNYGNQHSGVQYNQGFNQNAPPNNQQGAPVGGSRGRGKRSLRGGRGQSGNRQSSGGANRTPHTGPVETPISPEHFPSLPSTKKKTTAGYSQPFLKYNRETFASIIDKLVASEIPKPAGIPELSADCAIVRSTPLKQHNLLQPFPVMFPASPTPLHAAQSPSQFGLPPFLDLNDHPLEPIEADAKPKRASRAAPKYAQKPARGEQPAKSSDSATSQAPKKQQRKYSQKPNQQDGAQSSQAQAQGGAKPSGKSFASIFQGATGFTPAAPKPKPVPTAPAAPAAASSSSASLTSSTSASTAAAPATAPTEPVAQAAVTAAPANGSKRAK